MAGPVAPQLPAPGLTYVVGDPGDNYIAHGEMVSGRALDQEPGDSVVILALS